MKKLKISLGLICILAAMTALIIAVGSLAPKDPVESVEIDLAFYSFGPTRDHDHNYKYIFTRENGRYLMKYKPDGCDEWKEYKITPSEYYSIAGVDILNNEIKRPEVEYDLDYNIIKRYNDGHTQESDSYVLDLSCALIKITNRYGIREPVDMEILSVRRGMQFLFPYSYPYYYFTHKNNKYYLIHVINKGDNEMSEKAYEISEEDFNSIMSMKLPRDEKISRKDFSKLNYNMAYLRDRYDESYPYEHTITRRYNDGFAEWVSAIEELDPVNELDDLKEKYDVR